KQNRPPEERARLVARASRRVATNTELASILRDASATSSHSLLRMTAVFVSITLLTLQPHVLVGGPDRQRHQVDRVIGHARPNADEHPRAPDRREHHAVEGELLDTKEQDFTFRRVP